jgi:beta-glucosidase
MTTDLEAVIRQMTLEEKAALCTGASAWTTTPGERLGIVEMIVSDGPLRVRRAPDVHSMGQKSLSATCFPTASCFASTWDIDSVISRLISARIALHHPWFAHK